MICACRNESSYFTPHVDTNQKNKIKRTLEVNLNIEITKNILLS